jgi:uncharacterized protein (DUF433 family)/DNA-binding transcriptional ArsR family regulator
MKGKLPAEILWSRSLVPSPPITENTWDQSTLNVPIYTITEVSRYLRMSRATLSNWLRAKFCSAYTLQTGNKYRPPLIQRPIPDLPQLSFINLIEAHILKVIQESQKIPLYQVRIALDHLTEIFETSHPLVHHCFRTQGAARFVDFIALKQKDSKKMLEILDQLLTRIEWDQNKAIVRFFPFVGNNNLWDDSQKIITIAPQVSFGKPTITGTGIPTEVIFDFYQAGDSIETIATEYNCSPDIIKGVIQFENRQYKNHRASA